MTKLLYCEDCGDILQPLHAANKPRRCLCGRHAVWWLDAPKGVVRVCDMHGDNGEPAGAARAWLLAIANKFLQFKGTATADDIQAMLASPNNPMFAARGSAVVRFRPGETENSAWAPLPDVAGTPKVSTSVR